MSLIARKRFFDHVRAPLFKGHLTASQVSGTGHLLDIWEECYAPAQPDVRFLAYALATTFHETAGTMQPIEEIGKGKGHPYGLAAGPWHQVYDGRGDVQLTWYANYLKARQRLKAVMGIDIPFDEHPELAMEPDYAAHILFLGMVEGWFTGRKLADYFTPNLSDALHARRIVNALDRATLIRGYHVTVLGGLI